MSQAPGISVVLIFFNESRFLRDAVDSVFAQTCADWELLLVDDGSVDGSSDVAREYARQHPDRVRYLEHAGHANLGMSATRNLGIGAARGTYLSFIDADDVWLPRKLEQQRALAEAHPEAAMIVGRTQWWYGWTGSIADANRDFVQRIPVPLNTVVQPPALLRAVLEDEFASLSDVLVRRDVVEQVGAYDQAFRGLYEDQVFHAKICAAYPVFVASQTWYRYRQHADSCCARADNAGEKPAARGRFLAWLEHYLGQHAVTDPSLSTVLTRQRWPYRHPALARVRRAIRGLVGRVMSVALRVARVVLPASLRYALSRWWHYGISPLVGFVRMGQLRRVTPFCRDWGYSRGRPVDRYYIEAFLARQSGDVRGRVLEVAESTYTRRFGGDRVSAYDVLHSPIGDPGPEVTIIADLTEGGAIPSDAFDCVILTQTLLFIYDLRTAIATLHRIVKPGGVVLVTVPGITPFNHAAADTWGQYWSFTSLSIRALFAEVFRPEDVAVETHGNVLAATAFLYGLAVEDLRLEELDVRDPDFEVTIALRARKSVP